jgi:hypothetical protein
VQKQNQEGLKGSAWREPPAAPLYARALPPFRRCVGASLESGWCCTLRAVRRPMFSFGWLRTALDGRLGGFGAERLRLRLRAARFDARARCSGVVHVGCAGRCLGSVVARRAAACAVDPALFSVASRRSARALLGTLARRSACSARLWRVKGRRRDAARRMRGGAARRMAIGKEAERRLLRGGLTRALQAPFSTVRRRARRVQVRDVRCTGCAAWAEHGARRAAASEQSVQAHLGERCGPAAARRAAQEARGSVARVGCLLCRVRCAVTPSAGCTRADATRPVAAPLRQPRSQGGDMDMNSPAPDGARQVRARAPLPLQRARGSRPGGAGRPLHGHFSRYTTVLSF